MDKLLIGIDFGTSTNFVTKYDFNKKDAVAVANMGSYGNSNMFDNCIYIEREGKYILGDRTQLHRDPENFFDDVKRYIIDDNWKKRVPNLDNKNVSAQDISRMVFETIKKKIEENENKQIDGTVITVPYAYGKKYMERLLSSANEAGLKVLRLVEEPVAAAISYGIFGDEIKNNKKEKVAVFDLGGGTFDITIFNFEKKDNQHASIEVLNTDGVEKLGGKTIDDILSTKFREELGVEYSDIEKDKARIKFQNELNKISKEKKEELSFLEFIDIYENLNINSEQKELEIDLSREDFNGWLKDNNLIGKIEDALDRAIYDIDLEPSDIDRIVLAGGTSTIPLIKECVENFFGKKTEAKKELGELVGHGAGILAGLFYDLSLDYKVIRKTSKNIGISKGNRFKPILSKNFKYGESSAKYPVKLLNPESELSISFYEGDSSKIEDCEKIGQIIIDGRLFIDGEVSISLLKEDKSDAQVRCCLYDKDDNLIFNDYLQDI